MSNASGRGPRPLSEILGDLFTVRGYGRLLARQELEDAWNAAVGEPYCRQTRLGEVRRGVLNVTVAHSTLLEELAAFRKPALLEAVRAAALATTIHDIRFRVGPVVLDVEATCTMAPGSQAGRGDAKLTGSAVRPRRTGQASRHRSSHSSDSNPVEA
jgi:predicted nucleic acid-binding Zn ribbon protein